MLYSANNTKITVIHKKKKKKYIKTQKYKKIKIIFTYFYSKINETKNQIKHKKQSKQRK